MKTSENHYANRCEEVLFKMNNNVGAIRHD